MPDPYGIQLADPGRYSRGVFGLVDPSGIYILNYDMVFQTYVNGAVLPVELLSFKGVNSKEGNTVLWQTATPTNVDRFILERSKDGINFESLATVYSNKQQVYSFKDTQPFSTTYYRLSAVDANGQTKYFNIISIKKAVASINVYPAITSGKIAIHTKDAVSDGIIKITDLNGRTLLLKKATWSNDYPFDIAVLAKGLYIISVSTSIETVSFKIYRE